jgi:hypothetical protein
VILKCIANRGSSVKGVIEGTLISEHTKLDDFTVGRRYRPHAMAIFMNRLTVLVCDDYDYPVWLPIELFAVEEARLSARWEFAWYSDEVAGTPGRRGRQAIWGYRDIVQSESHFERLIDGDPEARRAFAVARQLMDDEEGL